MWNALTVSAVLLSGAPAPQASASDAKAAWEVLKASVGEWQGQASDGRKIRHRASLIAAGSALMEESWFEGHAGEMMVTMYHLDGDRLMLTHYCVAKNQPRMVATEIGDGGKRILFTFLDGTNIPTRDKGHMDKALYTFKGKDGFSSKWTWYSAGKEQWMEEFTFQRAKPAVAVGPSSLSAGSPSPSCCPAGPASISKGAFSTAGQAR